MTFEELMASRSGVWNGNVASVVGPDTYLWTVARGSPTAYEITKDGYKLMGTQEAPVEEVKPKRGRKPSVVLESVDE